MASVPNGREIWLSFAGWVAGTPAGWDLLCGCGWQAHADTDAGATALADAHAATCWAAGL